MRAQLPCVQQTKAWREWEVIEFSPRVKAEQAATRIIFESANHPEHTDADDYECDRCTATGCAVVDAILGIDDDNYTACTGCAYGCEGCQG